MISRLWAFISGPQVYRIYSTDRTSATYPQNVLENGGQQVLKGITLLISISQYMSPLIMIYLYKKNYTLDALCISAFKLTASITLLFCMSFAMRGIGRAFNPSYSNFLVNLKEDEEKQAKGNYTYALIAQKYDCSVSVLPASFEMKECNASSRVPSFFQEYFSVSGIAAHVLGRPLIYPGSIQLLQYLLTPHLEEGRANLILKEKGKRAIVKACDKNVIDSLFVDRRSRGTPQGSTLVICCEGNAGFYEIGIMATPVAAGYSVLGWNMPGFAGSSGQPFPNEVQSAADAVMQFAISGLGFSPDNIIVHGWSIGGYPASWLAQHYPDIRGLILDATFDHVLPLAVPHMPAVMSGLVKSVIESRFDLCTGRQASQYFGPITIIRRRNDEIISTTPGDVTTNRANELLVMVLQSRYPQLFSSASTRALSHYIAAGSETRKSEILMAHDVNSDEALGMLRSFFAEDVPSFPSELGVGHSEQEKTKLLLFLATKMLVDVDGGHANPLEVAVFKQPWSVVDDSSYEQVE
ncbi:Alpha/beta hydrolase fold-1 [Trinorchestia longiramus]|nr:Alpha/beta hydrolase fold-1 [Trinorchestia longiramus]